MKLTSLRNKKPYISTIEMPFDHLLPYIERLAHYECNLVLNPDYQRGHVWTTEEQESYLLHVFSGEDSGLDIWVNTYHESGDVEVVDGKQRITAVIDFLNNKIQVNGMYWSDFDETYLPDCYRFMWHRMKMKTKSEVISWYIKLNSTGKSHTDDEINMAKKLLDS